MAGRNGKAIAFSKNALYWNNFCLIGVREKVFKLKIMQRPYIYLITDTKHNMLYVGKCNNVVKHYFTGSKIIRGIVKKYGRKEANKFLKKEIIVQGDFNDELLNELEKHYIRLYATKYPDRTKKISTPRAPKSKYL